MGVRGLQIRPLWHGRIGYGNLRRGVYPSDWPHVRQLTQPMSEIGTMAFRTGEHQERGWSMTEQVPEDMTEAEVADRLEADRSEDEGDNASEVDRWDDEGGHDRAG
jgi:hypothetical protein